MLSFAGPLLRLRVDEKDYEIDLKRQSHHLAEATPAQR